ncbi:sensor histidine kinase [Streptomyces coffeae]|uniref:histidine kinase n=1 Tax=Streptomyces coffeae TaxID=621382 RepID=A0ABS1NCY0_9ACTN|nr:sensor histidine kinase [Streptomyces coffeae]MBL1097923.1 sensor domain-containing protein [Streptomyces coffeae]
MRPSAQPARTARALAYLAAGLPLGAAALLALLLLTASGAALAPVLVGVPLLALAALTGIPVAAAERQRMRLLDVPPPPTQHTAPDRPGLWPWARHRFTEGATWRELGYAVLLATTLWPLEAAALTLLVALPGALIATPPLLAMDGSEVKVLKLWSVTGQPVAFACAAAGCALLLLASHPLRALAAARARLIRVLLAPEIREVTVRELTRSRARLVDAFEAERRRIERDLHDGAQQRLVSLSMTLGLARLDIEPGTPLHAQLTRAHAEAQAALAELRDLVQGIHPQVLTDYGLPAALADAADRCPVPATADTQSLPRFPEAVESAAYFVVREALANAAKHSGAARVGISARYDDGRLTLTVNDDGRGGADPSAGTGLTGLADRLSVLTGTLALTSPPGGPTVLRAEIPCRPCA